MMLRPALVGGYIAILLGLLSFDALSTQRSSSERLRSREVIAATYAQLATRSARQLNDTAHRVSRITSVTLAPNDVLSVVVELADNQSWMEINLFNMLGKKVKEIYRGPMQSEDTPREYTANVSDLPNGLYILVVQGSNVRLADKVLISR